VFSISTNISVAVSGFIDAKAGLSVLPPERWTKNPGPGPDIFWGPSVLVLLMLFATSTSKATTIIAIRTPVYVVLASDSRFTGVSSGGIIYKSDCKIGQSGGVFFASSGFYESPTGFNAYDLIRKASADGFGIASTGDRFQQIALEPFKAAVEWIRKNSPAQFEKSCNNGDCLKVVFVGIEGGVPKLSIRNFHVTTSGAHVVVEPSGHHDCPPDCTGPAEQIIIGYADNANAILKRTPFFWDMNGFIGGSDKLIRQEMKANPKDVGLPVSILFIDMSGPHWIPEHQGVCPDIKK